MPNKGLTIDGKVLLIHPPMHHPACLPWKAQRVAAGLTALVKRLTVFDAGIDFFHKLLVPSPAWQRLRSAAWPRPETMIDDAKALDAALSRVSAAYPPCRLGRDGFAHPGLNTVEDLMAFREDPEANPFWRYAFERWQPFGAAAAPDGVVLCMTSAGQLPAAATLALALRRHRPEVPLFTVGAGDLADDARKELFFENHSPVAAEDIRLLAAHLRTLDTEGPSGDRHGRSIGGPQGLPVLRRCPLERPLAGDRIPALADEAAADGRKLIVWKSGNENATAVARQLHAVARRGIWNHLVLEGKSSADLEQFARTNANIVHSWCRREPAPSRFSDPHCRYPGVSPAYGETAPLPGKPLWMVLRDPVYLEAALERLDLKSLMRMRLADDGRRVFEAGQDLRFQFVSPENLPAGHLEEIVRMVAAGGSVQTRFVRHNLERAHLVAYAEETGVIVANSCLKHPRAEYIDAVSRQSGIDLHHFLERGYTSVRPEYRGLGIGTALLAGLTERAGEYKIFSVIAEGNIATQKMAVRNRTRRVATFYSRRARKAVGVWIPEGMLPAGIELPDQPDL
jgi:GNAT superfamily N-acetyltransferase